MNSRLVVALLSCLLVLTLAACSHSSGGGSTNMRIVNVIPDAPAISVSVGGNTAVSNLPFQQLTNYIGVSSGSQEIKVTANGGASNAIDQTLQLPSTQVTYIVFNPVASASALLVVDGGLPAPTSGTFAFRVINVAGGIGPVDVYLTPPGTNLNATSPTVASAAFGTVTGLQNPNPGSLELRVTPAGTKQVIYDTAAQNFTAGNFYEAVIFTVGSGQLVNVAMLNIDDTGTGQVNQNLLANFKVLNASQVPSPLNVLVDGNLTLSNLPFGSVSSYVTIPAGNHTFGVQATATPGADLLDVATTLSPATDTSIALNGASGALTATILADNNLPPPVGRAKIRFVNSSPNQGPLDVYINFSKQVSGLSTNTASTYIEETADASLGTPFEFDFNIAGTTSPVLKLPNITLIAGHTYSLYVIGVAPALQGLLVKDN